MPRSKQAGDHQRRHAVELANIQGLAEPDTEHGRDRPRSAAVSSKRFSILCQILELRRPWGAMILQLSRRSDIQRRPSRIPIMRQAAPVNAKAMNGCSRTKAAL